VRHKSGSHDPSVWMATEIRRLALSADEAAALCHHARHRTATGLLWVVASAAAGCTFRGSRLRHSNMPTFHSTHTTTASSRTGSSTSPTTAGIGGLARDDLLQEGAAALLHALDRWDPNRGRITTYSYLCAKYAMLRAIDNHARTIRLPVHAQEKLRRLVAARENLELRDRLPEYTGPTEARTGRRKAGHVAEKGASIYSVLPDRRRRRRHTPIISLARVAAEARVPLREAAVLLQHAKRVLSTDAPLGDNEGTSLHDVLVDHRINVAEAVEYSFMSESLAQLVRTHSGLEERERTVLLLRYGLHAEGTPIVARIVADRLGISLYKVRVAERNAIAKLRDDLQGLERDSYHEWMTSF
jgi:RNA polymerase sigma factor (sigma-70 family)